MEIEEIKKKAYEKYPAKLAVVDLKGQEPRQIDLNEEARNAYIEAYKEISALPTINGWVARDANGILALYDYEKKPTRREKTWRGSVNFFLLDEELLPDLRWEDEPKKVSVTIKAE